MDNLLFSSIALGARADAQEAARLLKLVGLESYASEPASSLSFGQRRLLEIVGTFLQRPKVLLLDEPAAGVNPALLEVLSAFILRMYEERPSVFLVIEHNMEFIMGLAREIVVMHQGAVLERGDPSAIQASPRVIEAYLG
jgi:ABC-type branched-subunit amino acid transport system ATPase component